MKDLIHPKQLLENDQITINQIAHGFAVGDYLNYDKTSSTWKKANTTGNYTDGAIGRVIDVESANTFELKTFGIIIDYAGVAGDYYYPKNDGSGTLTNVSPASIIQEVLFGLPGNKAVELKTLTKIKPQNSVYVSTNGNDSGNGTILNPFKTIQKAIDSSQVNGTVIIDSGAYTENLTIIDGINLIAVSKHTVTVIGKLTINNTTTNNGNAFEGINFENSTDHTIDHLSTIFHNLSFYECNITQKGIGAFNALNVTATNGDSQYKNTQISCQISTGGSRAIYTAVGSNFGMTFFDCLVGVEDNQDAVAIDLNGSGGFIFVGKNISGQTTANGDNIVLLAFGGVSTNSVPVLVTNMPTAPAIILNANIISSASPCVTGTGLFLFGNVFFFNGVYLDFATTLTGGAGAQAVKIDSALGLRYRNVLSGLTATNIQDAIDEVANSRRLAVNQTTHGFAVDDNIIYDKTSSSWKKANTIGNYAVGTIAKVLTVVDANNFVLTAQGKIIPFTGTAGEFYYAKDDGTGGVTLTVPTNVIQAVLFAIPGNLAIELSYPAVTPSAPITPSSTPLGYNDLRTSFTGANWNYEGLTNNGGGISLSGSIAVSGAIAGWRYLVVDPLGVVSVETIPPAEIISDISQHSPRPIFNSTNNGYYSSVNPTYRIIAIGYFDGTNLLETIAYSNGKRKNDDFWLSDYAGSIVVLTLNMRMQYTGAFILTRGDAITIVDNGAGSASGNGVNITTSKNGLLSLSFVFSYDNFTLPGSFIVKLLKNDAEYFLISGDATLINGDQRNAAIVCPIDDIPVNAGDFFSVVVTQASGGYFGSIDQIKATFKEY